MIFRKDALLFYQSEIFCVVMAVLCFTLMPMLGIEISFLCMLPFVVLVFANPKLYNELITINEVGISCQKSGKQLWGYEWESIAELKKSSRFLMPSIEVIAYNKQEESEQFAHPNQYFQLGKPAREALRRYYRDRGTVLLSPNDQ
jgi:hypothetical protein